MHLEWMERQDLAVNREEFRTQVTPRGLRGAYQCAKLEKHLPWLPEAHEETIVA